MLHGIYIRLTCLNLRSVTRGYFTATYNDLMTYNYVVTFIFVCWGLFQWVEGLLGMCVNRDRFKPWILTASCHWSIGSFTGTRKAPESTGYKCCARNAFSLTKFLARKVINPMNWMRHMQGHVWRYVKREVEYGQLELPPPIKTRSPLHGGHWTSESC